MNAQVIKLKSFTQVVELIIDDPTQGSNAFTVLDVASISERSWYYVKQFHEKALECWDPVVKDDPGRCLP